MSLKKIVRLDLEWNLKNKTALVCGASQGIGKACAIELAKKGARLVLLARDKNNLEKLKAELQGENEHISIAIDVQRRELLRTEIEGVLKSHKAIDILICNSGGPPGGKIITANDDEYLKAFSQHLLANQLLAQLIVPNMKKRAFGRIINILSTSVKSPIPNLGVSNTIRAAVASWAKTLAGELAPFGITVNNVLPGFTDTSRLTELMHQTAKRDDISPQQVNDRWINSIPLKRIGKASEVAAAVTFLAMPAASYITGINLPVDGGRTQSL